MLSSDEKKYLSKIPLNKKAVIFPYDPKVKEAVSIIRKKLDKDRRSWKTIWLGASALGIAGQNDIDFHILCSRLEFNKCAKKVERIFGERVPNTSVYKWEFKLKGFEVELYLSDPTDKNMKKQLKVFSILKKNKEFLKEYEKVKISCDGKSFRYYMRKKYEFYHKILGN